MSWIVTAIILVVVIVVVAVMIAMRSKIPQPPRPSDETASQAPNEAEGIVEAARRLQTDYWSLDPDEFNRLREPPVESLPWERRLRLLHLACLDMLSEDAIKRQLMSEEMEPTDAPEGPSRELVEKLLGLLTSESSPYRPRHVAVWQGRPGESASRQPDLQGVLRNASLTHLGCLEVLRLDGNERPVELAFVPLDDVQGIAFAGPGPFRYAKLLYDDGRPAEMVLAPLLYGISWSTPNSYDRDGTMTRFLCSMPIDGSVSRFSIGAGHQDCAIEQDGQVLFGLGSVGEFMVALAADDPKFTQKCKARGLDPDEILRSMKGG